MVGFSCFFLLWLFKARLEQNFLSHIEQGKFKWLLLVWALYILSFLKDFLHILQLCIMASVLCINALCSFTRSNDTKVFPHNQWLQRAENVYQGVVLLSIEWHDGPVADTGSWFDYDAVSNTWGTKYVTVSNTWAIKDTVTSYFTNCTLCSVTHTGACWKKVEIRSGAWKAWHQRDFFLLKIPPTPRLSALIPPSFDPSTLPPYGVVGVSSQLWGDRRCASSYRLRSSTNKNQVTFSSEETRLHTK